MLPQHPFMRVCDSVRTYLVFLIFRTEESIQVRLSGCTVHRTENGACETLQMCTIKFCITDYACLSAHSRYLCRYINRTG